jgi:hypothetical protein
VLPCACLYAHVYMQCLGVYVPADGQSLVVVPCNDPRTNLEWVYTQPGDNPSGIQLTSNDGPLCVLSPLLYSHRG